MTDKSESIGELAKALALAQAELKGALKDATNPFYKSKYADLESVWEAARVPLSKNNLSISQTTAIENDRTVVLTWLMHSSGQYLKGTMPIIASKPDAQGMGAAITYARRFALAAIVGIVQTDDDGETAVGRSHEKPAKEKEKEPPLWEDLEAPPATPQSRFDKHLAAKTPPGDYIIKIGKNHFNKKLRDIPEDEVMGAIEWLENDALKTGLPLSDLAKEFISNADAFFNTKKK